MKKSIFLTALGCAFCAISSQASQFKQTFHQYEFTQNYNIVVPKGSQGATKLWVPLPLHNEYQQVQSIEFEGDYQQAYITENNQYGAKTLFARWDENAAKRGLKIKILVKTQDREPKQQGLLQHYSPPEKIEYPIDVKPFLLATDHIKTDGIVKEYADKIVANEKNPLKQAELIHYWIVNNMERDNSVLGCGDGDVEKILRTGILKGKCTDINSVFVALARAVGIPAREVFGIRLGQAEKMGKYSATAFGSAKQGIANENTGQHCRAEFYLAGFGWVPVDSADVAKYRLTENKSVNDPQTQQVADYLFGNWEANWMGFNYARDFNLYPMPELAPINNFGYPYAEVGGDPLNSFDAKEFGYEFISEKR